MLSFDEIKELIKLVEGSSITNATIKRGETEITLSKETQTVVSAVQVSATTPPAIISPPAEQVTAPVEKEPIKVKEHTSEIVSPMVGTFYSSASPESSAFVTVGQRVKKGDTVCIVEAMKLFNEIEAEEDGEIVEILVENGQLVEYGQPLFLLK